MDNLEKRLTVLETEIALIKQSLESQATVLKDIKDSVAKNAVIMERLANITSETQENKKTIDNVYKKGTIKCLTAHERIDNIEASLNGIRKVGIGIIVMIVTQFFGIIAYAIEHWR